MDPELQLKAVEQLADALARIREECIITSDRSPYEVVCGQPDWNRGQLGCAELWDSPEVNPDGDLGYLWCGENSNLLAMACGIAGMTFNRHATAVCPSSPVAPYRCPNCNTERSISGMVYTERTSSHTCRRCAEWLSAVQDQPSNAVLNSRWLEIGRGSQATR
jgi:hypothetical protein